MRLSKGSYIFLMIFFFSSCVSKQSISEVNNSEKKDSTVIEKSIKIIPSIKETIIIEEPCDSLGNLKDFERKFKTPKSYFSVKPVNGKLQIIYKQDSLVNLVSSTTNNNWERKEKIKIVKEVRYKTNYKIILLLVISILVNVILLKTKFKLF